MKFFTVLVSSILVMNTLSMANEDIESGAMVPEIYESSDTEDSGFYIGGAYSYIDSSSRTIADTGNYIDSLSNINIYNHAIMLQTGYKFNSYIALEARYWNAFSGGDIELNGPLIFPQIPTLEGDVDVDAWGIYLKPMYPVLESVNVYALLGYGEPEIKGDNLSSQGIDGFQWGLGAEYIYMENVSIFFDFLRMYDDRTTMLVNNIKTDRDLELDTFNFGVTYKF